MYNLMKWAGAIGMALDAIWLDNNGISKPIVAIGLVCVALEYAYICHMDR